MDPETTSNIKTGSKCCFMENIRKQNQIINQYLNESRLEHVETANTAWQPNHTPISIWLAKGRKSNNQYIV